MEIHSTGEQKYYNFIEERVKNLRTGTIIWACMLAVTFLVLMSRAEIGVNASILLGVVGIVMAIVNIRSWNLLKHKLDVISDKENFYHQLVEPETMEIKEFHVIVTREYVLRYKADIFIYKLSDMEKMEVGIRKEGALKGKTLFLTEQNGHRNEIAVCNAGSGDDEAFDKLYFYLKKIMN